MPRRNILFIAVCVAFGVLWLMMWQRARVPEVERFQRIKVGMKRADVHQLLGRPLPTCDNIPAAPANLRIATLGEWTEEGCTLVVWYDKDSIVVSRLVLP